MTPKKYNGDIQRLEKMLADKPRRDILALAESLYEIGRAQARAGIIKDPGELADLARAGNALRRYGRAK